MQIKDNTNSLKQCLKIAVLYQSEPLPEIYGVTKPMKANGYIDGSADIAYSLKKEGFYVCTPVTDPNSNCDEDWVFQDNAEDIQRALGQRVNFIWPNTVLHALHPLYTTVIDFPNKSDSNKQELDDKVIAYDFMRRHGISPLSHIIIGKYLNKKVSSYSLEFENDMNLLVSLAKKSIRFPCIVKPIRGRGSEGVELVNNIIELKNAVKNILEKTFSYRGIIYNRFGSAALIEEFLPGEELTVTLFPKGIYRINGDFCVKNEPWILPIIRRIGHEKGVLPSINKLPPSINSTILTDDSSALHKLKHQCINLAKMMSIATPLRIDCRLDSQGNYRIFDLNIKPAITSSVRRNDINHNSLIDIAINSINMSYGDALSGIIYGYYLKKLVGVRYENSL